MQINITPLLTNSVSTLKINNVEITIPKEIFLDSLINELKNITLNAEIKFDEEYNLLLTGKMKGIMILKDDITLLPVEYNFTSELEEVLDKNKNTIDLTDILWQNILVEIPSKVRSTDEDVELSGDGWRVISEKKYQEERQKSNNPFANLDELIKAKEEE